MGHVEDDFVFGCRPTDVIVLESGACTDADAPMPASSAELAFENFALSSAFEAWGLPPSFLCTELGIKNLLYMPREDFEASDPAYCLHPS